MPRAVRLGRYQLLNQIAFGGMAEIYRAKTFTADGTPMLVAIKRVLRHLSEDDEFIQMLADEARIAGLLSHPAIARVFEFAKVGDEYFIAMEYVDGKDVRSILDKCRAEGRWIPPEMAAFIVAEALEGLHSAHETTDDQGRSLNLIHRDVSPSNIICSYEGAVKLVDFGIAKATLSRVKTRAGIIKGKVKYMSPEQAMGRKLDRRSDIFSAGIVLYEMLTRVPPFMARNEMELILKVRDAKYVPVREHNPAVPPALELIVDQAMSKSRSRRFQSALEFAQALRDYIAVHAAGLNRRHLSRYLKSLFRHEIDADRKVLASYELDFEEPAEQPDVGVNLIADALGAKAQYSGFSPSPTGHVQLDQNSGSLSQPNQGHPQAPSAGLEPASDSQSPQPSDEPTELLSNDEVDSLIVSSTHPAALAPRERDEDSLAGDIEVARQPVDHDAPTILLELSDELLMEAARRMEEASRRLDLRNQAENVTNDGEPPGPGGDVPSDSLHEMPTTILDRNSDLMAIIEQVRREAEATGLPTRVQLSDAPATSPDNEDSSPTGEPPPPPGTFPAQPPTGEPEQGQTASGPNLSRLAAGNAGTADPTSQPMVWHGGSQSPLPHPMGGTTTPGFPITTPPATFLPQDVPPPPTAPKDIKEDPLPPPPAPRDTKEDSLPPPPPPLPQSKNG